ncbi:hypothetical protein C9374_014534 [Naegleria lovaniensis]|uniref:Uncharacterized protein n=1 Tax=Naegleria lovaniensis TaxID=51637 RepID=A0AA88H0P3_NAELO|nr:uncharacterized protein C9374_014534 [Naegleria lovaniensis]KAG2389134.1 hypothetical protein C9374_014534 [Naegleria lovaniensis]
MLPPSAEIDSHTIVRVIGSEQIPFRNASDQITASTEKEIILDDNYEISDEDQDEELDKFAEEWEMEDEEVCTENGDIIIDESYKEETLRNINRSRAPYQPSSVVLDLSCADFLYDSSEEDRNDTTEEDGDVSTLAQHNDNNQSIQIYINDFYQNFSFNNQSILRKFKNRDVASISEALKAHKDRLEDIKEELIESGYNSLSVLNPTLTEICEHELALRLLENPMIFSDRNDISLNTNKRKVSLVRASTPVDNDDDFIDDSEATQEELPTPKKPKKSVKKILVLSQEEKEVAQEIANYISEDNYEMVKKYHKQFLLGNLSYGVVLESKLSYYFRNRELQSILAKERKKLKQQEIQEEEVRETFTQQRKEFLSQLIGSHTYKFPEYVMRHQQNCVVFAVERMLQGKSVIIAHQMGLGKTLTVLLTLFNYNRMQQKTLRYLVLVPKSNIDHFSSEYKTHFYPEPFMKIATIKGKETKEIDSYHNGGMLVMTYDRCLNMLKDDENGSYIVNNTDILIVDEAHIMKNEETARFMQFSKFKKALKILVTGTPLQNNIGEMFNLIRFIEPDNPHVKMLKPYFQTHFVKYLAEHKPYSKNGLLRTQLFRHYFKDLMHREVSIEELKTIEKNKNDFIIGYTLNDLERKIYNDICDVKRQMGTSSFFASYFYERVCLDCCTYLFQRDNSQLVAEMSKSLDLTQDEDEALKRLNESSVLFDNIKKRLEKYSESQIECSRIRIIRSVVSNIILRGEKVVIFSGLICYAPTVKQTLEEDKKVHCEIYSGELTDKQRSEVLQRFRNNETNTLIISKNAGGVGIDLTTAQHVILFNLDFNYAKDDQAIFRLVRKNQHKVVTIYRLVCHSSVDDKLLEIQRNKKIVSQMALDEIPTRPTESESTIDEEICRTIFKMSHLTRSLKKLIKSISEFKPTDKQEGVTQDEIRTHKEMFEKDTKLQLK